MAVDMPYEAKKGMREDLIPLFSSLHCMCMYTTSRDVGLMSGGGPLPDWMMEKINGTCRQKTKELLSPKPHRKEKCQ